jgi:hypothetical protein
MAFLSNAVITVTGSGAPVDISSSGNSCTINAGRHSLTSTAFGDTGDQQEPGLNFCSCSVELYLDYGSGSVEATLYDLLSNGSFSMEVHPSSGAAAADNPYWTLSDLMLESFSPINSTTGELAMVTFSANGGDWARVITP